MADTRNETSDGTATLAAVSSAMIALHKEQFGRGPKRARSDFAGASDPDHNTVFEIFDFEPVQPST
jgi:hypothetical protein